MLPGQGVKGVLGIIFSLTVNLRVLHVYLCLVGMFSWCCHEQETQCVSKPEALVNTCVPTNSREIKTRPLSQGMLRVLRMSFLGGASKPVFSGMHGLRFLIEALWDIVIFIFIYFISRLFHFFTLLFFFNFLFNTHNIKSKRLKHHFENMYLLKCHLMNENLTNKEGIKLKSLTERDDLIIDRA